MLRKFALLTLMTVLFLPASVARALSARKRVLQWRVCHAQSIYPDPIEAMLTI